MENKDVKMPPKTRGPMRGPGRGMMPKLKQVGKIDLDNLNKKTAPKVVEPVAKVIEQTPKDRKYGSTC